MTPRTNSFAHSFIHMSRRAKQKRHMQFIYCHSLDTPATPSTSGGRPRRWAGQRQLKRCRWRLIGFMPHLCVGANSWNCAAARLASLRLELVLKISSVMSVTWNRGQRQLGARRGEAWQPQTLCERRLATTRTIASCCHCWHTQLSRTLNEITRKLSDPTF